MSVASRRASSASSTELSRQRDLNKYYQPWLDSKKLRSVPVNTGPVEAARARCSHDTTLTAFAQLAALRLNVKRGMVSLIETNTQIILAEATQTLSLVDESRHAPGDHIWLGNVSLPRQDCIDEHAFGAITTCKDASGCDVDVSALVVNDTTQDARFKDRPYVAAERGVRFYAGVPIVTKQGNSIGVYAVTDIQPRPQGLTLEEIHFMQDVAQLVVGHLDRVGQSFVPVSRIDY
jgi:GAF domain-containing protein